MRIRLAMSVLLIGAFLLFQAAFEPFRTNVQARMAAGQVSNDPVVVGLARQAAQLDYVSTGAWVAVVVLLIVIWIWPARRKASR